MVAPLKVTVISPVVKFPGDDDLDISKVVEKAAPAEPARKLGVASALTALKFTNHGLNFDAVVVSALLDTPTLANTPPRAVLINVAKGL